MVKSGSPFPSLSHQDRETTKQYFHPVELMLDPDQRMCQLWLCPSSLTWVRDGEGHGAQVFQARVRSTEAALPVSRAQVATCQPVDAEGCQ